MTKQFTNKNNSFDQWRQNTNSQVDALGDTGEIYSSDNGDTINKVVTKITVTNPGTGYDTAPGVSFSGGTPSAAATATAIIENGGVIAVYITNHGAGYDTVPDVIIAAPTSGIQALATAEIGLNVVGSLNDLKDRKFNKSGGAISGNTSVTGTLSTTDDFSVNTNKFTVDGPTGNTTIAGDVAVNTNKFNVTAASGNTTIAGTLGVTGDVAVNTNKFNVAAATGNTTVGGTLSVSGTSSFTGNIVSNVNVTGDVAVNTNKFNVAAATGNTTVAGTLGVTGDVAVNTNKFNVAAATGNTTVGGTLSVTGTTTLNGNLIVNGTTTTVNSTVTTYDDPVITLGGDTAPGADDNKDRGVEFRWHNGSVAKVGYFGFDDSTGKFTFIPDAANTSEVFSGTKGTVDANIEWADVLNKPDPQVTVSITGAVTGSGSATLTDLGNGTANITTTIGNDSVTLGTHTTGNYVASVGSATPGAQTASSGLTISGSGEGAAVTIAHADTSSVTDLTSATNTFITAATFDTFGHVTARTTGTVDFNVAANYSFANITDGTTTAAADSNTDTFKIRSANNLLSVAVGSDDVTHGDNALFTVNQANITGVGTIASGTWQGTAVAPTYGGTGLNAGAVTQGKVLLGAASAGTFTLGDIEAADATIEVDTSVAGKIKLRSINTGSGSLNQVLDDANNSSVSNVDTFSHTTTGTPLNGIGTGLVFSTETSAGIKSGAAIESVATDVTSSSEDFDIVFKSMATGAVAAERARIKSDGKLTIPTGGSFQINGADVLTSTGLGSSVVSSSLTSVGVIGTGTWQGGVISSTYGGTGVNNAGRTLTINTNSGTLAFGAASKTLTVNNSIALSGTDGTTITLPSTTGTVPLNNQTMYIGTTAVTINRGSAALSLTGIDGVTHSSGISGNFTVGSNLVVSGDLTVSGTTTTVNTETVNIADNIVVLNSNYTLSAPSEDGGIEIERGTLTNAKVYWDETNDKWKVDSASGTGYIVLDSNNFGSYSPTLTGTGASGTWGIGISGNAGTVTNGVYTSGDQTIGGIKTFSSTIVGSVNGNAATVTNGVYTTGSYSDPSWLTISKSKVGLANVENTALSTWAGSANITTVGTIATGTWNATAIADGKIASALTGKTYNGLSLTAAATGFTVAGGTTSKTLTISNTLTLAGTDASTLNIGTGGTLGTAAFTASTAYAPAAGSTNIVTVGTLVAGTWNAGVIDSTYGGTGVNNAGRTLTINTNSGTLTFTNPTTTLTVANTASVSGTNTGDQTSVTGNAGTATAWQTARTITIGATGKSVDGTGNVSWNLTEIGAAATDQTMYIGTTAVAINRTSAALALTGITSIDGNAATVTNGVYTSGSYANPSWITSLAETKVLPTQTGNNGKYLTTNGTVTSWGDLVIPSGLTAGSTSVGFINYNGTTKTSGQWDGGTTAPTNTTRLNFDGYLYATKFYGDGSALTGISSGGYAANFGDGTNTTYTITHNLNSTDVIVAVREQPTGAFVYPDISYVDANNVSVTFASAPTSNQYRVIVKK